MNIQNLLKKHPNRIIFTLAIVGILIALSILLFSNTNQTPKSTYAEYTFITNTLPVIDTGHYALWGIELNGNTKLIKRFNYNGQNLISLNLTELKSIAINKDFVFQDYQITVEKLGDLDEVQSNCLLLSGKREGEKVIFKLVPLQTDKISASFILATHTDQTTTTNETSGLWFTNKLDSANTKTSLTLPLLPECWKYAAYVKYKDDYLNIGEFKTSDQYDEFSDYSYAQQEALKVPGEDFLRNLPNNIPAPINIAAENNQLILAIEPDKKIMPLKLQNGPFWEIMTYSFTGKEKPRIPIFMQRNPEYILELNIKEIEL